MRVFSGLWANHHGGMRSAAAGAKHSLSWRLIESHGCGAVTQRCVGGLIGCAAHGCAVPQVFHKEDVDNVYIQI
jgi:hypothetical protein